MLRRFGSADSTKNTEKAFCPGAAIFVMVCLSSCGAHVDTRARANTQHLVTAGHSLSCQQALELEKRLLEEPADLSARAKLVGFYSRHYSRYACGSQSRLREFHRHVLWFTRHCPECEALGSFDTALNPRRDKETYNQARQLWLGHVASHGSNTSILWNAAEFFRHGDPELAMQLLEKGHRIDPDNERWINKLNWLRYDSIGQRFSGVIGEPTAAAAYLGHMEEFLKGLSGANKELVRCFALSLAANAAVEAGRIELASRYARDLLRATHKSNVGCYWRAVHNANIVVGRVALKSGNIPQAKQYLIQASRIPQSPESAHFDVNISLARDLFLANEKDAVVQFLQNCKVFWRPWGTRFLEKWLRLIEDGKSPDFSMPPSYYF